ncbi:hypothetical protein BZA77DRAFT_360994 [Pyronema omphalodes]|nr:hypothetical protein BZA77DRAFT_360994 [Pyronema omphalodes]
MPLRQTSCSSPPDSSPRHIPESPSSHRQTSHPKPPPPPSQHQPTPPTASPPTHPHQHPMTSRRPGPMGPPPKPRTPSTSLGTDGKLYTYQSPRYSRAIPAHHHAFTRVEFPQETLLGKYKGPKMYMYYKPCYCTYMYKSTHCDPKCDLRHSPEFMVCSVAVPGGVQELLRRDEEGVNGMEMRIGFESCGCEWEWVKVGYWDKKEERLWESIRELREYQRRRMSEEMIGGNDGDGGDERHLEDSDADLEEVEDTGYGEEDEEEEEEEDENMELTLEAPTSQIRLATRQYSKSPELPPKRLAVGVLNLGQSPPSLQLSRMSPGARVASSTAPIRPNFINLPKPRMSLGSGMPLTTSPTISSAFQEQQTSRKSMGAMNTTGPSYSGISPTSSRCQTNERTLNRPATFSINRNRQSIPTTVPRPTTSSQRQFSTSAMDRNRQSIPVTSTIPHSRNRQSIPTALSSGSINRSPVSGKTSAGQGYMALSQRSPNIMSNRAAGVKDKQCE